MKRKLKYADYLLPRGSTDDLLIPKGTRDDLLRPRGDGDVAADPDDPLDPPNPPAGGIETL